MIVGITGMADTACGISLGEKRLGVGAEPKGTLCGYWTVGEERQ